jgi:diguanylate cyclase (GGDEF)-like protein
MKQNPAIEAIRTPSAGMVSIASISSLDGALAASMERMAWLAATVLHARAGVVALVGSDRRAFAWGEGIPAWFAHDPGVLVRSGIFARIAGAVGTVAVRDAREDKAPDVLAAAREMGIAGYAGVALLAPDGGSLGILCVFENAPRDWAEEELRILSTLGAIGATEVSLRRRLIDQENVKEQLKHDTLHDSLTGLPNRAFFTERLRHAVQRSRRHKEDMFAVLFLDLDNFKVVNDSVGHQSGDELLCMVARRLEACMRGGDMVARLGGDEFAVLLERISDVSDAARVAERIHGQLTAPVNLGGYEVFTSASVGIALSSSATDLPDVLLRSADMAMYRAKKRGRSRYEVFNTTMHAEALTRLQVETDLRRALERKEFILHYQPIISLRTGKITGIEALLRWQHPERGLVRPAEFVAAAEETGLILPLGQWVLMQACKHAQDLRASIPGRENLTMSVNLSGKQFSQPDLVEQVAEALQAAGLTPASLSLEITEGVVIEKTMLATQTIDGLKKIGVKIHMDDFGTGYSSLSYLHRLPVDAIKIDRAFVSHMDTEDRPQQVVRTILTLVQNLGLETIAEGVTNPEQLQLLRQLGCDAAQGFLFSPPVDLESITSMLREDPTW